MYNPENEIQEPAKWYEEDKKELCKHVFAYERKLEKDQVYRESDNLKHARLYGSYATKGLNAHQYTRRNTPSTARVPKVTMNIVQSMVDTVVSKICKNRPKPQFLTAAGDFSMQTKAKKLTKFIDGLFSSTSFYHLAQKAFLDACIFGTGAIKFLEKDGNICAEKVFINEIITDDIESYYGSPTQLHQIKYISRTVLKKMFPGNDIMIDESVSADNSFTSTANMGDLVKVIESWKLPSIKGSGDGKHSICTDKVTLHCEEYTKSYFPFVFFRWGEMPVGFFGQGVAEQLVGLQSEINKILRTI